MSWGRHACPTVSCPAHAQTFAVRGAGLRGPGPRLVQPQTPALWQPRWTLEGVGLCRRAGPGHGAFRGVTGAGRRLLPKGRGSPPGIQGPSRTSHAQHSPAHRDHRGNAPGSRCTSSGAGAMATPALTARPPRHPRVCRCLGGAPRRGCRLFTRDWLALLNFQTPPWSWGRRGGICA